MLVFSLRAVLLVALICFLGLVANSQPAAGSAGSRLVTTLAEMPDLTGPHCVVYVEGNSAGSISVGKLSQDWRSVDELASMLTTPRGNGFHKNCTSAGYVIRPRNAANLSLVRSVVKTIRLLPGATGAIDFGSYYLRIPLPAAANSKPDDRLILLGLNSENQVTLNGERYTKLDYVIEHLQEILDRRERFHLLRSRSDEIDKTVYLFAPDHTIFKEFEQLLTPVIDKTHPVPLVLDIDERIQK